MICPAFNLSRKKNRVKEVRYDFLAALSRIRVAGNEIDIALRIHEFRTANICLR